MGIFFQNAKKHPEVIFYFAIQYDVSECVQFWLKYTQSDFYKKQHFKKRAGSYQSFLSCGKLKSKKRNAPRGVKDFLNRLRNEPYKNEQIGKM